MRSFLNSIFSAFVMFSFVVNVIPCGPGFVTPIFDTRSAPESPFTAYAAGNLGIVKPTFRRSVLLAAYKHVAGGGLTSFEQEAMIDVWKAEFQNKEFVDDTVDEAVREWVKQRKSIVGDDEQLPQIYAERAYGGYDFFPNCTKNAFEVATATLTDRVASNGSDDVNVRNWIAAQDKVFQNCSSGKTQLEDAPIGSPEWLQKDREYQKAAADFYSLDFDAAKKRFSLIAEDGDSPWQETADYLVARTLIRQASLLKSSERTDAIYQEAEKHIESLIPKRGKFSESAQRLEGLIKYRRYPKERVSELAKKLAFFGGNDNFRQDVIDYTWLMDKFETEALRVVEKRKQDEERAKRQATAAAVSNTSNKVVNAANAAATGTNAVANATNQLSNIINTENSNREGAQNREKKDGDITIYLYNDDYSQSWTLHLDRNVTDEEALEEAEKVAGQLSEDMERRVREARRSGYLEAFASGRTIGYEGGYSGDEKLTPSLLPDFLIQDELTEWLFNYQIEGTEAYLYSLGRFKFTGSDLWLMAALSKSDKNSTDVSRLIEAAQNSRRNSPAYPTIAYHATRVLIEQGKSAESRKIIDETLNLGDLINTSARNSFLELRLKLAETLDEYIYYSLRKPFAFDFDGRKGTVEDFIAEQKTWYDAEYNTEGREAYEKEVEDRFREERLWQDRLMFDSETIEAFNHHFSTSKLQAVMDSSALPEYFKERFAIAIWTRAFLLGDSATMLKIAPVITKLRPELADSFLTVLSAKTSRTREDAALFLVLKNPVLSPFIEYGLGKTDNAQELFDANDWWCEPYDLEYDSTRDSDIPKGAPPKPAFLSQADRLAALGERKALKGIGDAPKFLADKVLTWQKRSPNDRRIPEALYIVIRANGWTKYGCGNNYELREELMTLLRTRYSRSDWTQKLEDDEFNK